MVTLKQIALECGVSVASVSKALNQAPDISAPTAERIRQKASELGYYPNAAARALKTNRSYNIGVVFDDETGVGLTHEYFNEVLNALKEQVNIHGYDITFISKNIGNQEMGYLEHCRYRNCDGVVVVCADFNDSSIEELGRGDLPFVSIDYVFEGKSAVLSDNRQGMYELVSHLYDKGHRKIAFIYGDDTMVTRSRMDGFRDFCKEHSMEIPDEYLISSAYHNPKQSALGTRQLMSLEDRPTCIIFPDDVSILGGITEIEKLGLKIPEDVSVAGYDGISFSRLMRPIVTTYKQDSVSLGRRAAELLIEAIENSGDYKPEVQHVPGSVQIGQTVKLLNIE